MKSLALKAMRTGFQFGSAVAPRATGRIALRLFRRPFDPMGPSDKKQQVIETGRARFAGAESRRIRHAKGHVQAYRFLPKPEQDRGETVAVVHGWANQAYFMSAFIEGLTAAGFRVVAFDLPAHGDSSGTETDPFDGARALQAVAAAFGPLHGVVAYSFGGAVTAVAVDGKPPLSGPLDAGRIAFISAPDAIVDITRRFGAMTGLGRAAQSAFEKALSLRGGRALDDLRTSAMFESRDIPLLVVHSRDDREIPFTDAERLARAGSATAFAPVDRLGHRRILYAPDVIERVVEFMQSPIPPRL
ncbi:alpha/beta hydrolase [Phreatobacter stygius]|uniref:Alpha/beta hydrolase n=1 Tax=Phreatobacter stygius TaxID=1940610 RepID=A0A4D7AZ85_9HYPH|nr:alpha/beta hydrolase [Phreatobacter stygius]QCI66659.1 alpha/beta hydrolase [Phreatobacter stygius]